MSHRQQTVVQESEMSARVSVQSPYWNLAEAAAWVVFRDMAVVDRFSPPDPDDWNAFMFYPSMRQEYLELGGAGDLFDALRAGRLVAFGRQGGPGVTVEAIPTMEWHDLIPDVDGPYRRLGGTTKDIPWREIRVRSADVRRLWRAQAEVLSRTKFEWVVIRRIHDEVSERNPKFSQNELISEIQGAYRDRFNKEPPSRSTIQGHLRRWQRTGQPAA